MPGIIQYASWGDFGYRKLGNLPDVPGGLSAAEVAEKLLREGDYESTPDHWVRRRARKKGTTCPTSVEVVDVLDEDTIMMVVGETDEISQEQKLEFIATEKISQKVY